ncbi:MAG: TRAP transporter small permease [Thiohalocapsa sp.]|jgi:C4-dicarboxylate transporter DctQ subunit|uniref:TRAP transporter small permease n=1 Tax=Thiohalocapsa sp. TaxID=2497641 RepID=UPI0025E2A131|nr:TRAP transporter small permease [Thiohalocapsa sp.]MCG6939972.1 TRAP transporter small permease [Thiohalocapsa sp.]
MIRRIIEKTEEAIISLLLVAMTLLVFWEVILRFGFGKGISWGQEATLQLSAWFVLFGVSYGLKTGAHIGVDAFVRLFPPLGRRILTGVAVLLSLVYCGLFIYGSWVYLAKMHMIGIELEDIPVQTWIAHSILLIGLVMLSLRLLGLLWRVIRGTAMDFQHVDEAMESMHLARELRESVGGDADPTTGGRRPDGAGEGGA